MIIAPFSDWNINLRYGLFYLCQFLLYAWSRYVVGPAKPGAARLLLASALIPVLCFLGFLFRADRLEEFTPAMYSALMFLWLTPLKLGAFCLNRGQLTKCYDSSNFGAFAALLVLPLLFDFETRPSAKGKSHDSNNTQHAYQDVQFKVVYYEKSEIWKQIMRHVIRIVVKVLIVAVLRNIVTDQLKTGRPFVRDFFIAWFFCLSTSYFEEVIGLVIMLMMRVKIRSSFDSPWLSQSVQEFWARYNLGFASTMKELIYDPLREGKWVGGPIYFNSKRPSVFRKLLAMCATFATSAFFHIVLNWLTYPMGPPIRFGLLFIVSFVIILAEMAIKQAFVSSGMYSFVSSGIPVWVYRAYAWSVMFTLGHYLAFPDLIEDGYIDSNLQATPVLRIGR